MHNFYFRYKYCCHYNLAKSSSNYEILNVQQSPNQLRINTITAAAVGDWETVIYEKQWYPGIIKKSINIALYVKFLAKKEKKRLFLLA